MQIQIHPEVGPLRKECELLRQKLGDQIAERDKRVTTIGPNLEADYQVIFGVLLTERLHLQVQTQRMRRKIELIRANLTRREIPDLSEIEMRLDQEFVVWQEKIQELLRKNRAAEIHFSNQRSLKESKELHQLYRALAKKLHPDLNPNLEKAKQELWYQVSTAYQTGDLETLKTISLIIEKEPQFLLNVAGLDGLKKFRADLLEKITQVANYIHDLDQIFPYNIRKEINDPLWIQGQKEIINKHIDAFQIQLAYLVTTMQEIFPDQE